MREQVKKRDALAHAAVDGYSKGVLETRDLNEAGARVSPDGSRLLYFRLPKAEPVDNNSDAKMSEVTFFMIPSRSLQGSRLRTLAGRPGWTRSFVRRRCDG